MKKVVLCGHTGSYNRGCEAIVRSTIQIFRECGMMPEALGTFAKHQDLELNLDQLCNIIEYRSYHNRITPMRVYNALAKKCLGNEGPEQRFVQKDIFALLKSVDAAVNIGGDTYCYNRPVVSYYLNRYAEKNHKNTILWSCSVESINEEMKQDLRRYRMIFPRETITYRNLLNAGIAPENLCLMADSAFVMESLPVDMPEGFEPGNTLGYNPSFSLAATMSPGAKFIESNREQFIEYIIKNTDMKIMFIPHVYAKDFGDAVTSRELYEKYKNTGRVSMIQKSLNCMELKYVISQCRMLIAERTHASIAAYSTGVPTFVLGYSVKSQGIAMDLFGSIDDYVLSVDALKDRNALSRRFRYILDNENEIHLHLNRIMPAYTKKARNGGRKLKEILEEGI